MEDPPARPRRRYESGRRTDVGVPQRATAADRNRSRTWGSRRRAGRPAPGPTESDIFFPFSRRRLHMKRTAWLSAVVLSAGLCTGAMAQVTGTVKIEGKAPERKPVAGLSNVKECAAQHKDPLLEE